MRTLGAMIAVLAISAVAGMLLETIEYVVDTFGAIGGVGLTILGISLMFAVATIED